MFRLAAAIILSSLAFAQSAQEAEIALAAKSPLTLARYVESHSTVDWKALRSALDLEESQYWLAPCGGNFGACSAEIATVANPDQAIVIIRGGGITYSVEYLRYLQDPKGGWQFAGENNASIRNGPSNHELVRVGGRPFLKISSNHSQNGVSVAQEIEDWFDLTQPDFEPVFSFTVDGGARHFGFPVDWTIQAHPMISETAGLKRINVILFVHFTGVGLDVPAQFNAIYDRPQGQKKFTLRSAGTGLGFGGAAMPAKDFEELADPFQFPSIEKQLVYTLPGLRDIATGSNQDAKKWLRSLLEEAKDTPEKRTLLELLTTPSAPGR